MDENNQVCKIRLQDFAQNARPWVHEKVVPMPELE